MAKGGPDMARGSSTSSPTPSQKLIAPVPAAACEPRSSTPDSSMIPPPKLFWPSRVSRPPASTTRPPVPVMAPETTPGPLSPNTKVPPSWIGPPTSTPCPAITSAPAVRSTPLARDTSPVRTNVSAADWSISRAPEPVRSPAKVCVVPEEPAPVSGAWKTTVPLSAIDEPSVSGATVTCSTPSATVIAPPSPLMLSSNTVPAPSTTRLPPPSLARPLARSTVCPAAGDRVIAPEPSTNTPP